ncbi:MAG TPA: YoaK family protein [Terriglobales bacterium]|nr:YoaK family protein [Terriglobales bacterium]
MALALSFAAGFVDIVGALTVYDLFTAHLTGTSVHLAERLMQRDWDAAIAAVVIVVAFFAASLVGRVLIEAAQRAGFTRISSITLALEAILLLAVVAVGMQTGLGGHAEKKAIPGVLAILALLAGAMGLQTASLTKIGPLTVHTTFVTGMINKLAQVTSLWLFDAFDLRRENSEGHRPVTHIHDHARKARFLFSLWILYLAGAAGGTLASGDLQLEALFVPCCILLVLIVVDQVRPLSIEEENEQAE